ncbi:MAG: hypothetical protein IKK33_13950 [Lachnospiraceae bacterium]|nr:hypothetical protein [Lachnospiraceae bacterium]
MNNVSKKKTEAWRIIVGVIAMAYIVFMWVKKDIVSIYTTMPQEEVLPLMITTIIVSMVKVVVITGGILLIKWGISKVKKN